MKELSTYFNARQHMHSQSFELFYYNDINLNHISSHSHSHYEFYFFLEGDLIYEVNQQQYTLTAGDYLLIPPDCPHQPIFCSDRNPYRRFVLWLDSNYFEALCQQASDFGYAFEAAAKKQQYHFQANFIISQAIQGKLMELIEETYSDRVFKATQTNLMIQTFLIYINRTTYNLLHQVSSSYNDVLYLNVCDYINNHLSDNLSLDALAAFFYISKYHLSHLFKDHMGISLHQYIIKKRLQASKNGILSGIPFTQIAQQYGFLDYTSFYRAFKKEFGLSPTQFKQQYPSPEQILF